MGEARKKLIEVDDVDERSHWDQAADYRKGEREAAGRALNHAKDILLGRKKPSRDPRTFMDRTGEQESELDREEAVRRRREQANAMTVRG